MGVGEIRDFKESERITLFCLHCFLVFIEVFFPSLQLFPIRRPNFRLSWRNYPAWRWQQCGRPQSQPLLTRKSYAKGYKWWPESGMLGV
jgi:hypothetical protein